jgi:hypothetical protein
MDKKKYGFFDCISNVTEWLVEVWALIRGLIILILVVVSILLNLGDTDESPATIILEHYSDTK